MRQDIIIIVVIIRLMANFIAVCIEEEFSEGGIIPKIELPLRLIVD